MKTLKCADLGITCDFSAAGETDQEVKDRFTQHAQEAHKELFASDESKQSTEAKINEILAGQATEAPAEEAPASETPAETTETPAEPAQEQTTENTEAGSQ